MTTTLHPDLWKITFAGETPGGEIFSHGMWVTAATGATATQVGNAGAAWLTAFLGASAAASGGTTILSLFAIGVDWHTVTVRPYVIATGVPSALPTTFSVAHGGTAADMFPPQIAIVITLYNGAAIGRRKYNRFYLPPVGSIASDGTGRVNPFTPDDLIHAVKAGNTAMHGLTPSVDMAYYSPSFHAVTALVDARCDDIFDTQRRRDDQLTPTTTILAF